MDYGLISLRDVLKDLKEKENYGTSGEQFEDTFKTILTKRDFQQYSFKENHTRYINSLLGLNKDKIKEKIKNLKIFVINKENIEPIKNNFFTLPNNIYIYIYQPFGSQQFPDFLIITEKWIIPLEVKYSSKPISTNSKPKWNSNIPKANSIYLFANPKNCTYFLGSDYISPNIIKKYNDYWKDYNEEDNLKKLNKKLVEDQENNNNLVNPIGIYPKIRIDYLTKKDFIWPKNMNEYKNIFDYSTKNKWEEHVNDFIKELSNEK